MQKKCSLIIFALALSFCGLAQTKKIAHRSHSGSKHSFTINAPGNFGWVPVEMLTEPAKISKITPTDSTKEQKNEEGKLQKKNPKTEPKKKTIRKDENKNKPKN